MHDPHKFIGNVRRKNIEFVIDTHDDYTSGKYDQNKETETIEFVKGIQELGMKGIVYAPYTRHINKLKDKADEIDTNMVVAYHGGMLRDQHNSHISIQEQPMQDNDINESIRYGCRYTRHPSCISSCTIRLAPRLYTGNWTCCP